MPAWSFRSRFHAALANGLAQAAGDPPPFPGIKPKRQTIRARRRDGRDPLPGESRRIWLDQRTPHRVFVGETPPIKRAAIRIPHRGHVEIEGVSLTPGGVTKLARADGFDSAAEMFDFLEGDHGPFPFFGYRFRW